MPARQESACWMRTAEGDLRGARRLAERNPGRDDGWPTGFEGGPWEYRRNDLAEFGCRSLIRLGEPERGVEYFRRHYRVPGGDSARSREIELYVLLRLLDERGLREQWLRAYETALEQGVKPRDELRRRYRELEGDDSAHLTAADSQPPPRPRPRDGDNPGVRPFARRQPAARGRLSRAAAPSVEDGSQPDDPGYSAMRHCIMVRIDLDRKDFRGQIVPTSTLTSKGQTTIPKAVREHLDLRPGQRIDFVVQEDGTVVLRPATYDVRELAGILHRPDREPLSVEEMNEIIRRRGAGR